MCPLREVKASKGKVISDKDLEILLDRSDLLGKERQQLSLFVINYKSTCLPCNSDSLIINVGIISHGLQDISCKNQLLHFFKRFIIKL